MAIAVTQRMEQRVTWRERAVALWVSSMQPNSGQSCGRGGERRRIKAVYGSMVRGRILICPATPGACGMSSVEFGTATGKSVALGRVVQRFDYADDKGGDLGLWS